MQQWRIGELGESRILMRNFILNSSILEQTSLILDHDSKVSTWKQAYEGNIVIEIISTTRTSSKDLPIARAVRAKGCAHTPRKLPILRYLWQPFSSALRPTARRT
jgi:hypothetical protein